jgi:uncharacterized cupin superfamily protein
MTITPAYLRTTTEATDWEPFLVSGEAIGEVHWLQTKASDAERTLYVGMWRSEPQTFPYSYTADETIVALEGELEIAYANGDKVTLVPGDIAWFAKGTETTYTVVKPFKKLFVIND